jgi:zinc transport system substrate-binding protein
MVMAVRLLAAIFATLLASALPGAEARLRVVTSFLPIYCWTVNVAGEHAIVENLLPARAEPHEYGFTPGDARKLSTADLIVINGLGLESWAQKFLRNSPSATNKIVPVTARLDEPQLIYGEHHHHGHADKHDEHEQPNEHIWLDPVLAAHGVSNILAALQRIDPTNANAYAVNAQACVARLHALDTEIRQGLAEVTNRAIVTYHDAFPYFAQRYGLEVAGMVQQVPEVNPTPKYLARLGKIMRERGIRVICVPHGGRTRLAQRIATDLRVELIELDTLESGALSPSAYEERMRANAAVLRKHLK